LSKIRFFKNCN